ncbi:MAG: UDP-N-acetylglucosamine 4,6-dehydratase family protein, partial [Plesiomonas sp.]
QTVYHAAAYKHVPLVEHNVVEGVRNNVFGTLYCAQSAIASGVETFVLISTDKAVRPTNTMGTTKRLAELVLQALSAEQSKTRFCMVRFGNVLGSSGSVVPLFERQISQGGPVTLTHRDIIRYFMTIPEASQLVIQAGAMGKGGDVFVLDMGDPVKIYDLAKRMIRLSGLTVRNENNPEGDIAIEVTGLRPGEKLYEELLIGDSVKGTTHPRIMSANEVMLNWAELSVLLKQLDEACHDFDHEKIRQLLLKAPAAFQPTDGICDLVWQAKQESGVLSNVVHL